MRNRLILFARLVIPVVLLAWLWRVVDPAALRDTLSGMSIGLLALAVGVVQMQIVLGALRWRLTARSIGHSLGTRTAITEYYGASLVNMVLPGGVSGDVVRVARGREHGRGVAGLERSAHGVVLERASGQVAFALVAATGLVLWTVDGDGPVPVAASAGLGGGALVGLAVAAVAGVIAIGPTGRVGAAMRRLGIAARLAFLHPRRAALQTGLSTVIVASYLTVFALASRSVGAPLDPWQTLLLVPPVLLTMILPISIGGWGVRETAAAAIWPLAGYTASQGIAASALYGVVTTLGAMPGVAAFSFPLRVEGSHDHDGSADRRA